MPSVDDCRSSYCWPAGIFCWPDATATLTDGTAVWRRSSTGGGARRGWHGAVDTLSTRARDAAEHVMGRDPASVSCRRMSADSAGHRSTSANARFNVQLASLSVSWTISFATATSCLPKVRNTGCVMSWLQLRFNYDTTHGMTTTHRARPLRIRRKQKMNMSIFRCSRIVVESQ